MDAQEPPSGQAREQILNVFRRLDPPSTPITTDEAAGELGWNRRTAAEELRALTDDGVLRTKSVGEGARVWWRPADHHRTDDSSDFAHAQFRELVRAVTNYAIFALDRDGYVRTWNAGAEQIKGYERDEIVGEHFSTFYTEAAREAGRPEENLRKALERGRIKDEGERVRKDGSTFWADVVITPLYDDGELRGYVKITRDMTERHRYEERLRHEKERFETLVREVRDYAIFRLDSDGYVQTWNEGARTMKGYEQDEIVGEHFSAFYTEADREAGRPEENLRKALERGRVEDEGERVRKDGSTFWADVVITPLYDDGELRGFSKVTRDMTERHQYEQTIENERERLEFMNRIVRHNVLNGLNLVNARTEVLQEMIADDAAEQDHLDTIRRRVTDLAALINTMRKFMDAVVSGVDHDIEPVSVRGKLTEKVELARDSYPNAVFEIRDLPDASTRVIADELIGEVFENVLSNAVIHNDKETPRIEVWTSEATHEVVVDSETGELLPTRSTDVVTADTEVREHPAVVIHVADNGPGIADGEKEEILEKGISGMGTPGNGLGLYLVKEMMSAYGGHVDVHDWNSVAGARPDFPAAEGVVFDLVFLNAEAMGEER